MLTTVQQHLQKLKEEIDPIVFHEGQTLFLNGQCQILSQGQHRFSFLIDDEFGDYQIDVEIHEDYVAAIGKGKKEAEQQYLIACVLQIIDELQRAEPKDIPAGKAYTREGMIHRVLSERRERAAKAEYRISFGSNPYGEHILTNEKGVRYKLTFHDLEKETGYCSCKDYRANKLGTCKHLMFAYQKKKGEKTSLRKPRTAFPFVEVGLDPLQNYQIRWFHPDPEQIGEEIRDLLEQYFGSNTHLPKEDRAIRHLLRFTQVAEEKHKEILIRPEVYGQIEEAYTNQMMASIGKHHQMDLSGIRATLYPYQLRGVEFAAYKKGVIIADEMGLGKTLQAIATAIVKKDAFGFERTLVLCPASVKNQWKNEIEKFTDETAEVIEGKPEYREERYRDSEAFFLIMNYETVLRDRHLINRHAPDFIILDEAQRIKNYETITARSIKGLEKKHALVITGTPIENRLIDLFSIMDFIDPYFLAPLWEFSYQHCYFDHQLKNKITGYYNLQSLKERLGDVLLRRTKREVIKELPNITHLDIPVEMHPEARQLHTGFASGIGKILSKKFITPYDMNRLMMLLNQMRMVCDSTFLIDKETNHSPKLDELKHILTEKLDMHNSDRKVIIFSEWTRMNGLIGKVLRELDIHFVELNGKVPVPKRQALVDTFYHDETCKVFLSTEAGGAGLNLQAADTVINFELPWNPAKKNQRIGRIDRLGQKADQLTVINLITRDSIEIRIATGLALKQNLFESVLDQDSVSDEVDFSEKGRAQFLKELQAIIDDMTKPGPAYSETEAEEEARRAALADMAKEFGEDFDAEEEIEETQDDQNTDAQETVEEPVSDPIGKPQELTQPTPEQEPQPVGLTESPKQGHEPSPQKAPQIKEMEQVMNHGMSFLAGMFKMATGTDLTAEDQKIEIDEKTGEVVMRFKLPGMG